MADAGTQLRVGRLTKAHGLKGAIKLELYTDDPERRFVPGAEFSLQVPAGSPWHGKHLTLRELRWYNGHPVGFFEGVDDRTAAESLAKAILWVSHTDDEAGEPDAWYDHQLIGLSVLRDGVRIGEVTHVDHLPAQDLLIVRVDAERAGGREVMVPFVGAIVPEVDLEAGTLTVTPPAGLFEEVVDEAAAAPVADLTERAVEGEPEASDSADDRDE
ncbi:ribosome maturation factor RimM [Agromyces humatus]|uniref:Ribosome maturation factor RimM n=1 Tax=Agromyces humatus TaxID=279573 RepID=A0ABP4WFF6_9MICO|nr:ribosome maturation factor RimM [Agromyces humatus]